MIKNRLKPIPLETRNSNTLDPVVFSEINEPGLPYPCSIIRVINDTATSIEISYDGSVAHDYIRPNSELQLEIEANKYPNVACMMAKDTIIYARGTPGTGFVSVSGYYQEES